MRMRLVARTAAGLLLAGSLAACFPAEETPAFITAQPNPVQLDLPTTGTGNGSASIVVRNLGPGTIAAGELSTSSNVGTDPAEVGTVIAGIGVTGNCASVELEPNETCSLTVNVSGRVPQLPYTAEVRIDNTRGAPIVVPIVFV